MCLISTIVATFRLLQFSLALQPQFPWISWYSLHYKLFLPFLVIRFPQKFLFITISSFSKSYFRTSRRPFHNSLLCFSLIPSCLFYGPIMSCNVIFTFIWFYNYPCFFYRTLLKIVIHNNIIMNVTSLETTARPRYSARERRARLYCSIM